MMVVLLRQLKAALKNSGLTTLMVVFVIALAPRVAMALWLPARVLWADGARYVQVAFNLLHGYGFGSLYDNQLSVPTPPLLIAASMYLFGSDYVALRLIMAVIGSLSCVLGYVIARQVFDKRVALIAGLILSFYPLLVYLSALFEYPQPLYIVLIGAFFVLYFLFKSSERLVFLALAGLVLGLAVLTLPTALIFLASGGALFICRNVYLSLSRVAVYFIAALLPIGLWTVRNHQEYGRWVLFNAAGGYSLWQANNDQYLKYGKTGVVSDRPCNSSGSAAGFCAEYDALVRQASTKSLSDVDRILEFDRLARQKALEFISRDLSTTLRLSLRKLVEFWSPIPNAVTRGTFQGSKLATLVSFASYVPVLLLAIYGFFRSRALWRHLMPFYLYLVTMVAPYSLFLPTTRYRLPVDFVLAIFAAYGFVALRGWSVLERRLPVLSRLV